MGLMLFATCLAQTGFVTIVLMYLICSFSSYVVEKNLVYVDVPCDQCIALLRITLQKIYTIIRNHTYAVAFGWCVYSFASGMASYVKLPVNIVRKYCSLV
jgi:hypothetical protein